MSRPVKILYFAWLRERVGRSNEELELPDGVATLAALADTLAARGGGYASAFQDRNVLRCALNQEFSDLSSPVQPGDEVAFFPPVTGG